MAPEILAIAADRVGDDARNENEAKGWPMPEELIEAQRALSGWTWAAREALKAAGVEAPAWPDALKGAGVFASAIVADLVQSNRWLLSFDHEMRPLLIRVPDDAYVIPASGFAGVIADPTFPKEYLPAIADAALGRSVFRNMRGNA